MTFFQNGTINSCTEENVVISYLFFIPKYAQSSSSGTTNRQRINVDVFLDQSIPLPSLKEQNKIVEAYNKKIQLAEQQNKQASDLKKEIENYLFEELGIEKQERTEKQKGLQIIKFSEISSTWGIDFMTKGKTQSGLKFPLRKIKDICSISSGGTPSRANKAYYKGDIPWIKTGELKDGIIHDTEEKITELGLHNSSAKLYSKGSVIVAMYGATIGKTALLGVDSTTNQACAVLFDIDNSVLRTEYLWFYLQQRVDHLKTLAYGSAQPNLNAGIIANYPIIIPSLSKQNEIVENITSLKKKIKNLCQQAEQNRQQAIIDFENTIFS